MGALRWVISVVIVAAVLFAVYAWVTLTWSYSTGERAGYVQKLSKKGWICKTWEGELAMVTMPGTLAEKFLFSVREDAIADQINRSMGRRVSLQYEEHVGIPTTCFAETRYFVVGVKVVDDLPPPASAPQPAQPQPAQPPGAEPVPPMPPAPEPSR